MPLILHLFKKDFRRAQLLVAVWLLLVLLQCGLMGASLPAGAGLTHGIYWAFSNLGPLLKGIVLAVLVALLVLEEPPAGTTGFWLTRPLPPAKVLQAKTLFAVFLIVLPLVLEAGVLLAGGVTRHDVALAVPEIVLRQLELLVGVGVIASLTANFGQFGIACAVVVVATELFSVAADGLRTLLVPLDYRAWQEHAGLEHSRTIAAGAWVIVGLGAVFIYQYLTRRSRRALVAAVIIQLGGIAAQHFWPWNFFPRPPSPPAEIAVDASTIKLQLRESQVQDMFLSQTGGEPKKNLTGSLLLVGVPEGYLALPTKVRPQLSLADGTRLPAAEPIRSNYIYGGNTKVLEAVLGGVILLNGERSGAVPTGLALIEADSFRQHADQAFTYSADIEFALARYAIVADMALAKGSRNDRGSAHEFITAVLREGPGVNVILHRRDVNLLLGQPRGFGEDGFMFGMGYPTNRMYVLRNRRTGEAALTKMNGVNRLTQPLNDSRLVQEDWSLSFGPDGYRGSMVALDPSWLADAELLELELVTVGKFSEHLVVANFTLEGPNRAKTLAPEGPAPSATVLSPLTLPPAADKAEVKKYVDRALVLSQKWTSYQKTDPPVGILLKVGPENLDVLIDTLDRAQSLYPARLYLEEAILELSRPQDKALILGSLVANPILINVVVKFNWEPDCRDVLLAVLRDKNESYLPLDWIRAVASFKDPATYPLLKDYLLRTGKKLRIYNVIRKLPGIDLRESIDALWKRAKRSSPDTVGDAAGIAIDVGYPDALEALVGILRDDDRSQPQELNQATTLVKRYTSATGDRPAIVAWYEANKGRLVFDPERRKFILQPSAAGSK